MCLCLHIQLGQRLPTGAQRKPVRWFCCLCAGAGRSPGAEIPVPAEVKKYQVAGIYERNVPVAEGGVEMQLYSLH